MTRNKKIIITIIIAVIAVLAWAPWLNNQSLHDKVFEERAELDGTIDKDGNLICDYNVNWFPFGRYIASCEGGYFATFWGKILFPSKISKIQGINESKKEVELQVHFIDVGQGDSILIDLGLNEVLIDGGGKSPGVTDYISKYIDGPLEIIIATHPHADHIGGLIKVLEVFQVEEIWLNGDAGTSKITYPNFMAAVNAEGAEVNQAKRNGTISTGDLNFSILNPPDTLFSDINNNSIVLRLEYGDIMFLFTGDAEEEAEASILVSEDEFQAQILKAGHHCSRTSSSMPFLEKVKPERAICMVGENNRYGHPHQETLTALEEIGSEIYRTDTDGTIIVLTDGIDYEIKTSK